MSIKANDQLRLARAVARAEAAAARAEQIVQLLEAHLEQTEGAPATDMAPALKSERLQATEGAIVDLAAMFAEMAGGV